MDEKPCRKMYPVETQERFKVGFTPVASGAVFAGK